MTSGEGDGFLNGFPTEGRLGAEAGILAEKTLASARQDAIICLSLPTDLGPCHVPTACCQWHSMNIHRKDELMVLQGVNWLKRINRRNRRKLVWRAPHVHRLLHMVQDRV